MSTALRILVLFSCVLAFAQQNPEYIGSRKCKLCHNKVEQGSQYDKWSTGPHARAYQTLLTEKAQAIARAQELGTSPEAAPECLRCHVTGWGAAGGYQLSVDASDTRAVKRNKDLASIGCESCHGAGSLYKSKKTMTAITAGEMDGASLGLKNPDESDCKSCHNSDSPTYRPFDYKERAATIAHDDPNY